MSSPAGTRHGGQQYRLRRPARSAADFRLTAEQRLITGNRAARLRVLAGPGTGKTASIVEAVAERVLERGVPLEQILVLTFSRRAAAELAGRITLRLGLSCREPAARTLHSYAYSIVRAQAERSGEPPPRLLAAGESDQMVRELLAGHRAAGASGWPAALAQALGSEAFAAELQDLLLKAAARGIGPNRLIELGRAAKRGEWVAAGQFAREIQQVSDLRQGISGLGVALDAGELTAAALSALTRDDVLAAEQHRFRRIFVDEYQDVDPAQARLIAVLGSAADEVILAGDPDQSVYAFRGSDPGAMRAADVDTTVELTVSRRLPPDLVRASRLVAARLPGAFGHRRLQLPPACLDGDPEAEARPDGTLAAPHPAVTVRVYPTAAREASAIADFLRRAHLLRGVAWDSMVVLLRSPAAGLPALTRACAVAGVPVVIGAADQILAAEPLIAALLGVLECGVRPAALTGEVAMSLLSGPLAAVDVLGVRRLRRLLRAGRQAEGSSADLLAAALAGAPLPRAVPPELARPVGLLAELLRISRAGAPSPTAQQVLWELWQRCGLQDQLVSAVERGGTSGQRADRSLDAVVELFAMAADLAGRLPAAGVSAFLALVHGRRVPGDEESRGARSADAVSIISAHAAKGREWDVVAVAGVQEGTWPDLRPRDGLLSVPELLDKAAGIPSTARVSELLADERRLFYVAATRARRALICTAVLGQDTVPSRFLQEIAGIDEDLPVQDDRQSGDGSTGRRSLHLTDLIADLRRTVVDPAAPDVDVAAAARQLAVLAEAGVTGAHPRDWYGLAPRSTDDPPIPLGATVNISPSTVEALSTCGLRAVLERRGGRGEPGQAQLEGIVVHAIAHGLALGLPEPELAAEIERFVATQDRLPRWQVDRSRRALFAMLSAASSWVRSTHPPRRLIGSELAIEVALPPGGVTAGQPPPDGPLVGENPPAGRPVRLSGRIDWLSQRPDGTLVVTDFKTGSRVPSRAEAEANPQLAAYQSAIALGATWAGSMPADSSVPGTPDPGNPVPGIPVPGIPVRGTLEPGGAELVYLRSGMAKVLRQEALGGESVDQWLEVIRGAAAQLVSVTALAQENPGCERCPVRTSCPLQSEGAAVTR